MRLPGVWTSRAVPALDVAGRAVLVTGAAQGIGRAVAQSLHDRGAAVALTDVDADKVDRAASELGGAAIGLAADVRDRAAMARVVEAAATRFGGLDIVVANAGVSPAPATLRTMTGDDFDRVVDINLSGVFNTVKPALEHVITAGGHVVMVCSGAAFTPGPGGSPYMVSKAGVEQLARALRLELAGHSATVQIAYFGLVDTAMTHDLLDDHPLGQRIAALLPWPLNRRISTADAARSIVDGITGRASTTMAPAGWRLYSWLRGVANPVLDRLLSADATVRQLIADLENEDGDNDRFPTER